VRSGGTFADWKRAFADVDPETVRPWQRWEPALPV
jgi:hypothetical protein